MKAAKPLHIVLATNPNPTRTRGYPLNINPKPDSISGPAGSGRVADLYSNGTIDVPVVVQQRGVGMDGTEGSAFWDILAEIPGSQTGLPRGAWGGIASPKRALLAAGKMGRGENEETTRCTLSSRGPENPETKEIALSLKKWVLWTNGGTEIKRNRGFSSRPSSGGKSGTVLAVSWKRANANIFGLPALLQKAQRAGLGVDLARGGAAL